MAVWIVFPNTKIIFCLFGVVFVKLIFGLSLGWFCAMFMAELWTQLGQVCCRVKGLFSG